MPNPEILVLTGAKNSGKTTLLTKLYETIIRIYDNYELCIHKVPINSLGDFLADITIKPNSHSVKKQKGKNVDNTKGDIRLKFHCNLVINNNDDSKQNIRILINTAGDQSGNFKNLEKKNFDDFDFVILARKDNVVFPSSNKFLHNIKKDESFSNNVLFESEKNFLKLLTMIVDYISSQFEAQH